MFMNKAAKENLILYQMDVKTAYLHAPIDYEIYVEQPEGYDVKSQTNEKMLCKLKKSLYGWRVIRCRSALIIAIRWFPMYLRLSEKLWLHPTQESG